MKKSLIRTSLRFVRVGMKRSVGLFLRLSGIQLLTKTQTEAYLKPYQLGSIPESRVLLPGVHDAAVPEKVLFNPVEAVAPQDYVWHYMGSRKQTVQLAYGNIVADRKILCANYGSHHIIRNFVRWKPRMPYSAEVLIAPWSHYVDGVMFGGYYDFLILVASKLCRIKDVLPEKTFAQAVVSYPLFRTAYERELLVLIGIRPDRVVDSRMDKIRPGQCVIGSSGHWFYPNVGDVLR